MKIKNFLSALTGLLFSMNLFSCSATDEPKAITKDDSDKEFIEYTLTIDSNTENLWTRSFDPTIRGNDGLIEIPNREINKLWYGVYYKNQLVYTSEDENSPEVNQVENGKFTMTILFNKTWSSSDISFFFWAGNIKDDVVINSERNDYDLKNVNTHKIKNAVFLNLKQRYYTVNTFKLNDREGDDWEICNSFTGSSSLQNIVNNNSKITLRRPFTQIHLLSDEFHTVAGLKSAYSEGITCLPTWCMNGSMYYTVVTNDLANSYKYGIQYSYQYDFDEAVKYTNSLTNKPGETVNYKGREMDYLGCFYILGGSALSSQLAITWGNNSFAWGYEMHFNFVLIPANNESLNNKIDIYFSDLTTKNFKSNVRYVIYNKEGTSFTTNTYNLEIDEVVEYDEDQNYEK